ncbi:MAG TPA: ORF6N domain-containing protein [Lacunisphaera sp.]|nr:ORF6N domain-containing protein [Lacunisphaera sp.]
MNKRAQPAPGDPLESRIHTIRGQKVILDADLAALYGVTTKRLNEQVKRNAKRFPPDFMFQLTRTEMSALRSQTATSSSLDNADDSLAPNRSQFATGSNRHRDPRLLPYAFTENGAVMAANVLNSEQAVRMSVFVVRAFVRMRELLSSSKELAVELKELEAKLTDRLDVHETAITEVLRRIMQLLDPPPAPSLPHKSMGFHTTMKRPARKSV